ncbi:ATP-dependent RNA helicase HrpA [Halioxenophilus sp. WMMB6]|uniref:ATP-dependent RNA helicase HrpA n=1 Tax=Halioxenophilus sp. WMMB6 TaxID=3073815 RepID=UPI00295EE912|nr:ATP-dependent RNA helicase HrpA [Halioxenophilus sp. WMMB6]
MEDLPIDFAKTLGKDRPQLARLRQDIEHRQRTNKPFDRLLAKMSELVAQSTLAVEQKRERLPEIQFPPELPISEKRELIAEAIAEHQVVVLAGETGSGKTTQLPKICLSLGRGITGMIGHTQPRRLAASTVAARIAEELQVELGQGVGYQVRFADLSTQLSYIKLMTDGILLAEIQQDPLLNKYDTLIIDEAHERSLNIDFLLGYLKTLLPKRPDLKLIITSATIDLERFSQHFNGAPIIEVSGRTYPVEVRYRPPVSDLDESNQAILNAIDELLLEERSSGNRGGDFLVFLSGEREIRECAQFLRRAELAHVEVLPLYARLSLKEQTRVFGSHKGRRIVLATNVAETSVTVPGIRYVIDPGQARISRYSYRTKIQRLPIEAISQASANQRKGRCGRVSAGVCIRLYDEADFLARPEFTDAEILRTNLASVILQMLQLRLGDIRRFPFIDAPDNRLINDGFNLLKQLRAVDERGHLSALGRKLATLPLDPRLGAILLAAAEQRSLAEVLLIVSALSVQDPRERPADKQQAADEKHRRFWHEQSDLLAYLSLWQHFESLRQELSQNQLRKQCQKEFISYQRMREWRDVHHQLLLACQQLAIKPNREAAEYEAIHKPMLVGLLDNVGQKTNDGDYLGTRNRKFNIFPGSSQFKKRPAWLVAAELLETSKLYAHSVAKVEPEWVLAAAGHLVKRNYFEPHYDSRRGQVFAYERVTLFGLTLVEKQRINYSTINAKESREVFIRRALVEGAYSTIDKSRRQKGSGNRKPVGEFFLHNQKLIHDILECEAKFRRRDLLVEDEVLFTFYNERVGDEVVNLASFEAWREEAEKSQPRLLFIERELLLANSDVMGGQAQFPDSLEWAGMEFPLSYHFEPGSAEDGVSVHVPVGLLHQVPENLLQWLVPGLLKEKCAALIKSLPKQWRKQFVPVPTFVDKAVVAMSVGNTPLIEALSQQLFRQTSVKVPEDVWQPENLDAYYRMNIKVDDERGRLIEQSRDLVELREKYRDNIQQTIQAAGEELEQQQLVAWSFGDLPESRQLQRRGVKIKAFPALVDQGDSVALKMHDNPLEAEAFSLRAQVRLAMLAEKSRVKYLQKELLKGKDIGLSVTNMGGRAEVTEDIIAAAFKQMVFSGQIVRQQADFEQLLNQHGSEVVARAQALEELLAKVLVQVVAIRKSIKSNKNPLALTWAAQDIQQQLDNLLYTGFLFDTDYDQFQQYPRYLQAIVLRLDKVAQNVQRDRQNLSLVQEHWQRYQDLLEQRGRFWGYANEALQSYRWLIEELRVSLFAQTLKTRQPVSAKRLDKLWEEIKQSL